MIKEIAKDIIFVTGASRSAIYDLEAGKVYSVNKEGTKILSDVIEGKVLSSEIEKNYIFQVKSMLGIEQESGLKSDDVVFPVSEPVLLHTSLELTQKCNSRCIHCYEGQAHTETDNPLTDEDWYSMIDELSDINCKKIQFIGGEPTLYPKLADLISYAASKKFEGIYLFSNLNHVSSELKKTIVDNKVYVRFSIYGSSPEVHDSITQIKGSFSKMIDNVRFFKEHDVPLQGCIVIMKENESDTDNIRDFLHDLGISNVKYDEVRKVYGVCQNAHMVTKPKVLMKKPDFSTSKERFFHAGRHNTCWYGKTVISTNGSVLPCEFERNIVYGNVKRQSIYDIIHSESTEKYWYINFNDINVCCDCEYRFACRDCRPVAFAEKGCLYDKNPRCTYDPYSGSWNVD